MRSTERAYENAVKVLRVCDQKWKKSDRKGRAEFTDCREEVLEKYQPIFSTQSLGKMTKDEFWSFLLIENNHHWTGLHRQAPRLCEDMSALRRNIQNLLDETQPISNRVTTCIDSTSGMGVGICTAILLVAYPDSCGVWNSKSEGALHRLRIWPRFERGLTIGEKYELVNKLLNRLVAVDVKHIETVIGFN